MEEKLRILVVDDSAFMRRAVTEIIESDQSIKVVGSARNGLECLQKIKALSPDVIILDIDMPIMDGLTSIRHLMIESPVPIVVLSSLFSEGAITFEALRLGVVDFVPKPSGAISENIDKAKQNIIDRVKIAHSVNLKNVRRVKLGSWNREEKLIDMYRFHQLEYILALGTNLSGPNTVIRLLSTLSPSIPVAVVVVQEISPEILDAFVRKFDENVPWKVDVATDGKVLEQGICYLSSNKKHLKIQTNADGNPCIRIRDGGNASLNLLFTSAASIFHQNTIGVLLTGIGDDGADGLASIRKVSGVTMAQESRCCVYPNLTDNAVKKGVVDILLDETRLCQAIETIVT